jgi:transposase
MLNFIVNSKNNNLFTPAFSPNLNPIKNTLGIIKNIYREQLKDNHYDNKN